MPKDAALIDWAASSIVLRGDAVLTIDVEADESSLTTY